MVVQCFRKICGAGDQPFLAAAIDKEQQTGDAGLGIQGERLHDPAIIDDRVCERQTNDSVVLLYDGHRLKSPNEIDTEEFSLGIGSGLDAESLGHCVHAIPERL